jgi:multisite-specific tRNA:(cytosine-C5)-methyltransferase
MVLVDDSQLGSEQFKVNSSTIAIGCWKGKASLTVMVTTVDCHQLIQRLSDRSKEKEKAENCFKTAETA